MNKYSVNLLPAETLVKIAEDHRELRKQVNLLQRELAERSGISLGSLKRFERTGQISLQSSLKLLHFHNRLDQFSTLLETKSNYAEIDALFSDKTRR
ncbi:MAG: helix-turn-helix domain-containing protein [Crocinitomix sp.]|nr:helix-turn-helix domain-containing protein [Crocinitomix sp.]